MTQATTPSLPTTPTGNAEWAHAMELFLGQLIDVLEGEGRKNFSAAALQRWSDLCAQRMLETGSVPSGVVTQLQGIASRTAA